MTWAARIPVFLLVVLAAVSAAADESPVRVTLEPWAAFDGVDRPHRYIVTMRAASEVEVVADRRLLSFEVRPEGSRRRHRCRHPAVPARTPSARIRTLAAGEVWREWIDLRMYCWGRALTALESGGEVRVRYGWRRRSRSRWIARTPETPWRRWTGGVESEPFRFAALERAEAPGRDASSAAPIRVSLSAGSARSGAALRFRVAVRATEGRRRVYVRPDRFAFQVRGPTGEVGCQLPRGGGFAPPDLFRRITTRAAWRELLDAGAFCPPGTFRSAGIYEITPELTLDHDGAEWDFDAVTGSFVGTAVPFRVASGEGGYVEQIPEPGR